MGNKKAIFIPYPEGYMNIEQIFKDLFTTALAVFTGIFFYKKLNRFHRLILLQVVLYILVDISALSISPNLWLYNLFMPVETTLLLLTAAEGFSGKRNNIILILGLTFWLVYILQLFLGDIRQNFFNIAALTEGLVISIIFISLLYKEFSLGNNAINIPVILSSLGIVFYFSGTIPYISSMESFSFLSPLLNKELFTSIIVVLASVRYLLIAIAFCLVGTGVISLKHIG